MWCGAEFEDGRGLSSHVRNQHPGVYMRRGYRPKYTADNAQFWIEDEDEEDEDDDE